MKSPKEIKQGLICHNRLVGCFDVDNHTQCPYINDIRTSCISPMVKDALEYINQLESQLAAAPRWRKYPEEKPAADGLYYIYYGDNHKDKAMICNFNTEYGYFGMYAYDFDKEKEDFIEEKDIAMWMEVPKEVSE